MTEHLTHCLILFAGTLNGEPLRQEPVTAYALLPEAFTNQHPEVVKRLQDTGIFVVRNGDDPPVFAEDGRLEMFEFILKGTVDPISIDSDHDNYSNLLHFFRKINIRFGTKSDDTFDVPLAFDKGNSEVCERLLSHQRFFLQSGEKCNILHYVANRKLDIFSRFLLERGVDVRSDLSDGTTPLHLAAAKGSSAIVKQILATNDVDVDARDGRKSTPLHLAAGKGFSIIVQQLLDSGASVNVHDDKNTSPLHLAADKGFSEIVQLLLSKDHPIDGCDIRNSTPLHLAADKGFTAIVTQLLTKDAPVNVFDCRSASPLHLAVGKGFSEIVQQLLSRDAAVDIFDSSNATPLHLAAGKGFSEIVQQLLLRNASVDVHDRNNATPLHLAAEKGFSAVVQQLLDRNAPINIRDGANKTPLLLAASKGFSEIVQMLLDRSASVDIEDDDGNTPLHLAAIHNFPSVVQLLVERNVPVDAVNKGGFTPLHGTKNEEVAEILLRNHADARARSNDGSTPLHVAASGDKGSYAVVRLLIQRGALVNARNDSQSTPLNDVDLPEVADILLRSGADVNSTNLHGSTPIIRAVTKDLLKLVKVLVKYGANVKFNRNSILSLAISHSSKSRSPAHTTFSYLLESCFVDPTLLKASLTECSSQRRWEQFRGVLARHIVKIKAINNERHHFDGLGPEPYIDGNGAALDRFKSMCETEVTRAKNQEFGCSGGVSVYDILTKNDCEVAGLLRNDSVAIQIDENDWQKLYPLYGNMLTYQIDKGKLRNSMIDEGLQLCDFAFRAIRKMPEEVTRIILSYLNVEDIFNLRRACSRRVTVT